jgi:ADP-ribose pyrophosphatase
MGDTFAVIGSTLVYEGALLDLEVRTLRAPDGAVLQREVVHHPGAVAVLLMDGSDAVLIRQHRTAVGGDVLEIPAGLLDRAGEPPEEAAARECVEEVGLRPRRLTRLGGIHTSVGFTDEYIHLFLGEDPVAEDAGQAHGEEAALQVVRIPFDQLARQARDGQLDDAKTIVAVLAVAARRDADTGS